MRATSRTCRASWLGQPIARARSMAVHESQSLSFEMQLGRSAGFIGLLAPKLQAAFGAQSAAFETANLQRLMTRVQPGLIRVDADELTYPAHVILRYEIERRLIEGEHRSRRHSGRCGTSGMQELLGIDTRGNYADGCMQDVHWSDGLFGYFPCYTLGAMYRSAVVRGDAAARCPISTRASPKGELDGVFDWLRDNVWQQASR